MTKVLVTGANGFIGSHLIEKLVSQGHQAIALVRKSSDLQFLNPFNIEIRYADVRNYDSLVNAFKGIDVVIHNAGLASDWGNYRVFEEINVNGTKNVAQASIAKNIKRIVYMSSTAIHGFGSKTIMNEESPKNHNDFPYSKSKQVAEDWLFNFAKSSDIEITAIRPGNVFGPRDHTFMKKYIKAILEGKAAEINGGTSKTCPTYVENLADAVVLACFHPKAINESFIITDGWDIDWKDFNNTVLKALPIQKKMTSYPYILAYSAGWILEKIYSMIRSSQPPLITTYRVQNGGKNYFFSIEKAKSILGFSPTISLEEGIRKTVQWYFESEKK